MISEELPRLLGEFNSNLKATDFDPHMRVILTLDDGSHHEWVSAFYLPFGDYYIVFAEHDGFHLEHQNEVVSIGMFKRVPKTQKLALENGKLIRKDIEK